VGLIFTGRVQVVFKVLMMKENLIVNGLILYIVLGIMVIITYIERHHEIIVDKIVQEFQVSVVP